jgi:site-specific DNA-cytosine methylase
MATGANCADGTKLVATLTIVKALGNAVSPPCAYYIGRAIMNVEQERTE